MKILKKTKPFHILLISFIFSPNIGGVESHLDDLTSYLTKKGYFITVLTYQPLAAKRNASGYERGHNIEIMRIPWLKFNLFNRLEKLPLLEFLYLVPPILFYSFFYLLRNRKNVNVIQTHGFNMAFIGAVLNSIFRIPFTINTHVSFYFQKESLYSKILVNVLKRAKRVLVLTNESKKQLINIGIPKEKVWVYHQWIDTGLFKPYDKKKSRVRLRLPLDKFIAFFAGRFITAKGLDLLLQAAEKTDKQINLVFVGSGELKNKLQQKAQERNNIYFAGEVVRNDLPYYYSAADVQIMPSKQATAIYAEGIPRVMIEAFTCGTPVVATPTGGLHELIKEHVGFFIEPTQTSIVLTLNALLAKKKLVAKMGKQSIGYAKEQFDMKKNAAIIEKSLFEL